VSDAAEFPFDDARRALSFALNAHASASIPSPTMNRAMAEAPPKVTKKERAAIAKAWAEAGVEELVVRASARTAPRRAPDWWRQLDEPARAGAVLLELNKLDARHRLVLEGLLIRSHTPCSCRSPCCSGWAVNARWSRAVDETCRLLAGEADLLAQPGKKGLSTQPALRRLSVEQYFTGRELTLTDLARVTDVSMVTAAKHRALIQEWLLKTEGEAWPDVSSLLDAAGITGTILEGPAAPAAARPASAPRLMPAALSERLRASRGGMK
jgi:hypothetical protein